MRCPTCKGDIPESALACPYCVELRSHAAMLEYQRLLLPAVVAGQADLRLAKLAKALTHLELYGDPDHAYCGTPLKQPTRTRRPYAMLDSGNVCAACCAVLHQLITTPNLRAVLADANSNPDRPIQIFSSSYAEVDSWATEVLKGATSETAAVNVYQTVEVQVGFITKRSKQHA